MNVAWQVPGGIAVPDQAAPRAAPRGRRRALLGGTKSALEFEPFLDWQSQTFLSQPGNQIGEIVDLVQLREGGVARFGAVSPNLKPYAAYSRFVPGCFKVCTRMPEVRCWTHPVSARLQPGLP